MGGRLNNPEIEHNWRWPKIKKDLLSVRIALKFLGHWFAERILRRFLFWKILEHMQARLSAQRCHDGRSHASLEYVGLAAIVWGAVCSRKQRWNRVPNRAACRVHLDAAGFSTDFLRIFAWLPNTYFLSAKTLTKNLPKICAKILRENLRTKNLGKNLCKNGRQKKICAKICAPNKK